MARQRADIFLVEHGYAATRTEAQAAIRAGNVRCNGDVVTKPAQMLDKEMIITYEPAHPYVSRGGVKLAAALDHFKLSPKDLVCLDLGASTGGFTQVLLERGAKKVYAVDVGHGQLHPTLDKDPRILRREGVNARDLTAKQVPEAPQAITADLSFISLKLALAPALALAAPGAWAAFLVKPQFEVGRWGVAKNGIVKNEEARLKALDDIAEWLEEQKWKTLGTMKSPIEGGEGNIEYFIAVEKPAGILERNR